eukprot:3239767-Alexandrium_andersonii.AAC.1
MGRQLQGCDEAPGDGGHLGEAREGPSPEVGGHDHRGWRAQQPRVHQQTEGSHAGSDLLRGGPAARVESVGAQRARQLQAGGGPWLGQLGSQRRLHAGGRHPAGWLVPEVRRHPHLREPGQA